MDKSLHIVSLGDIILDMFPSEIGKGFSEVSSFRPVPGGAPANVAVAAARLGYRSAFLGKVGDDPFGVLLVDALKNNGVETRGIRRDSSARTTLNFMVMPDVNRCECLFYRNPGADMLYSREDLDLHLLQQARALHFGSLSLVDEPNYGAVMEAVRIVRAAGGMVSFDVNYRPSLWKSPEAARERIMQAVRLADVLKVNEVEVALLAGEGPLEDTTRKLAGCGPALVVATLGPSGSAFRRGSHFGAVPAFPVTTVDATGCGDAFIAGLLCQVTSSGKRLADLDAGDLRRFLRFANAVGALTATRQGVIPALPTGEEVRGLLG